MLRIQIVRATVAAGRVLAVGECPEHLPDDEAWALVRLGKAVVITGPTINGDPDPGAPRPRHRDPAVRRTRAAS